MTQMASVRYAHTNIVARDWRALAQFYCDVFGCTPVPPERDFHGEDFDRLTGLKNARLQGIHLRLPGWGDDGPTLEIFQYTPSEDAVARAIHHQGFGHLAFAVADVQAMRTAVLESGGSTIGEVVTLPVTSERRVTVCYARDPEGNAIELQAWSGHA